MSSPARNESADPSSEKAAGDITRLFTSGADPSEVYDAVYGELKKLAQKRMSQERSGHTLQATALVNEVYLRLLGSADVQWRDRRHFFGAAAEAMRRILVDHARKALSEKRGGQAARLDLSLSGFADDTDPELVLMLEDALTKLADTEPRGAEIARMKIFGGFSSDDIAAALELTPRTVQRDWAYARARLSEILEL